MLANYLIGSTPLAHCWGLKQTCHNSVEESAEIVTFIREFYGQTVTCDTKVAFKATCETQSIHVAQASVIFRCSISFIVLEVLELDHKDAACLHRIQSLEGAR